MNTYQLDLTAMRCIGVASISIGVIEIYTLCHAAFSILLGLFPNPFVLGCCAGAFLLDNYIEHLISKHNFDLNDVIEQRRKELDDEGDF